MLLYKGYEFFAENTPQVHESFDRFTNISKSIVSSMYFIAKHQNLLKI